MTELNGCTQRRDGEKVGAEWQPVLEVPVRSGPRSPLHADAEALPAGSQTGPGRVLSLIRALPPALPAFSGAIVSFLPVGICPICWPVYAGLLSSLGLGFLLQTAYLLPVTLVLLALAVAGLAYRAGKRRGYGPLALGLVASVIIVIARFVASVDAVVYPGIGLLIAAGLWNAWPKRAGSNATCPACAPNSKHKGD